MGREYVSQAKKLKAEHPKIAEREGMTKMAVSEIVCKKIPDLEKPYKVQADFADAAFFVPPNMGYVVNRIAENRNWADNLSER